VKHLASQIQQRLRQPPPWREVWQLPTLVLGVLLFVMGLVAAWDQPQEPDFGAALHSAQQYLLAQNVEAARDKLRTIEPLLPEASGEHRALFHQLWGDMIFLNIELARYENRFDTHENYGRVIEAYHEAESLGASFGPRRLQQWAEALIALDRDEEALAKVDQIPTDQAHRRYAVVRAMIERERSEASPDPQSLLTLLDRYREELGEETDPARRRAGEIWALTIRADALLASGASERAIDLLLRRMSYLQGEQPEEDLAPLMVKLGQAYLQSDEYEKSQTWLQLGQQKLAESDGLNAAILVGLAEIELAGAERNQQEADASANVRKALEYYTAVTSRYPSEPQFLSALIGRAFCEARLEDHPRAIEDFRRAVAKLNERPGRHPEARRELQRIVEDQHTLAFQAEDYSLALEYLEVLQPLHREGGRPPTMLAKFAETHEMLAESQLAQAKQYDEKLLRSSSPDPSTVKSRRLANRAAAKHFAKAGEFYQRHARAVLVDDDEAFGRSLWKSANAFFQAQDWERAIDTLSEFVSSRPTDRRYLDGLHKLGLAYQASGQYQTARDTFEQLIDRHPTTMQAYQSIVPLAECHIALDEVDEAKRWLNYVIDGLVARSADGERVGGGITPDSAVYRDALVELGRLHYHLDEYEQAIEKLSEAVEPERYGRSRQGATLRYYLADSHRLSVEPIESELEGPLRAVRRRALSSDRARRLVQAQILYSQVIAELESRDPSDLTTLEQLFHRNAYFYRADAAFELGRFEQAIDLYDLAADRFEQHPAALVAMIQIVNAYCELDQLDKARLANERARWMLERIPDEKFDDPTLPMSREHWQDWLRWTSELDLFADAANG